MTPLDTAYHERDQLVAALSKVWPSYYGRASDAEPGWQYVVYIEGPTGQLSWHVPDHEIPELFGHLTERDSNWDGHTTEEKYKRLAELETGPQVFDIPAMWRATTATNREYHHEQCSYRTDAMLCDCAAMTAARHVFDEMKDNY